MLLIAFKNYDTICQSLITPIYHVEIWYDNRPKFVFRALTRYCDRGLWDRSSPRSDVTSIRVIYSVATCALRDLCPAVNSD